MRVACTTQNSAEWHAARTGKVTASRIADAMAKLTRASKSGSKGDWTAGHMNYVSEIAWELITGNPAEHYVSKPMEIGSQYENEARIEYWMRFGTEVDETGLVLHPTLDFLGASPDGLVGKDGLVEFKVPTFRVHCSYLESGEVPADYQMQMQCQMLCCERQWNDFVSYCPPDIAPELPEEFRMFRKRLFANKAIFAEMEEAATKTMEQAIALVQTLRQQYPVGSVQRSKIDAQLKASVDKFDESNLDGPEWSFLDNSLAGVP